MIQGVIPLSSSFRSIIIILIFVGSLLFISFKLTKEWDQAGIYTTLVILFLFYYGIFFSALQGKKLFDSNSSYHIATITILLVFIVIISILLHLYQKKTKLWRIITIYLNIVAVIAIAITMIPILRIIPGFINDPLRGWNHPGNDIELMIINDEINLPDIYYIILDGYGREDILNEIYDLNNADFLNALRDKGFYVADNSRSNYLQTALSLASSLNMDYIQNFNLGEVKSSNREPLKELIASSNIRSILKEYGYTFIGFDSGYSNTSIPNADMYLSPYIKINTFEEVLLTYLSPASILEEVSRNVIPLYTYQTHRTRAQFTFDQLTKIPSISGPKFTFAHIVLPHPPFVFDKFGNPITPEWGFSMRDANDFLGSADEYKFGYSNQTVYVNHLMLDVIDKIIYQSAIPPIIIIQGDHGPRMLTDWSDYEGSCTWEASSILNAYYIAGIKNNELYTTITPVNTFRLILNSLTFTNLSLLDDIVYYSNYVEPYDFIDITEESLLVCP